MINERQIKPLRKYTLTFPDYLENRSETFTADNHLIDENMITFYNTGNVIRQYFQLPLKLEITPVDEADIPE